ncbi:histidine kinase [Bacillus sp. SA1-12]|uniref:sensor histidine kinase n=1 Tax=Bacillus sp. SA1-12 TaxID=1455638 RepID=UPI0006271320|nr:ATP-binding protein [Bacillus sp. SA1-12]KKI89174.1 histidine kinase [Bacillus sp. SA1-12]
MKKLSRNMSFRTKILTILLLLTVVLSGFSLILVQSIEDITQVSNKIKERNIPELVWLSQLEKELDVKEYIVKNAIKNEMCCELTKEYQAYASSDLTERNEDSIPKSLEPLIKSINLLDFIIINNVQGLLNYNDKKAAEEYITTQYLPQLTELKKDLEAAKEASYSRLDGHSNSFTDIIKNSLWLLILLTTGAIALSIFVSYRISASLTKPIETMIDKVDLIANGRYGLTLDSPNQLELQHLTHSINQMSSRLQESFNTILNDKMYREQILNSLPVGIITINDQTSEISLNTAAVKLLHTNELQVKQLASSYHNQENELFWSILSSKKNDKHTKVPFTTSEDERFLLVSQTELLNQNHLVIGRIINFIDITETDKLEKRIHQSEKLAAVGEMAAGAAHEIRNPLAVVHGFLSLMNQSFSEQDKSKYHLSLIMKEIERINVIIEEMLLLSKPGAPIKRETYLEDILGDFLPLIIHSSEEVEFTIKLDRIPLEVDAKQIKQVFHNMIRNSIEAMGGKGVISISSQVTDKDYQIFLKDSGPGIPASIMDSLFEPFSSSKENGTGLGLTIVKRIVENHGGCIKLYETSDAGTTFLISLPLTK